MTDKFIIKLQRLRFYSQIGAFAQEQIVGNDFEVNVEIEYSANNFKEEDLSTTISYADVYDEIEKIMHQKSNLLETCCIKIKETLQTRWTQILRGRIEIIKLAPPIPGIDGNCGVEFFFEKS